MSHVTTSLFNRRYGLDYLTDAQRRDDVRVSGSDTIEVVPVKAYPSKAWPNIITEQSLEAVLEECPDAIITKELTDVASIKADVPMSSGILGRLWDSIHPSLP